MTRNEVIRCIKRDNHPYYYGVILLSDFLNITREEAKQIWIEEFGIDSVPVYKGGGGRRRKKV